MSLPEKKVKQLIDLMNSMSSASIPAGEVKKLLEKYKDEIAVMNCFCRQYKNINDMDPCKQDLPLETCMSLGAINTARYFL